LKRMEGFHCYCPKVVYRPWEGLVGSLAKLFFFPSCKPPEAVEKKQMSGIKIGERLDLYATLGLNRSSRDLDLKRAYKKLALSNHPDKNKGTEAEFLYIGFAYHVLSNPKLRAVYDANEVEFATSRQKLIENFNSEKALEIFDAFFGKNLQRLPFLHGVLR
jgi:hypothetical protein